ncbi:effector-associated constant component EACC1 [Glycomyces paridis]|uniref:Uncharacterized protein n=1 Tax=Glycomyces paridis TaxID=2126555 RepID=A0A4S8P0X2_9ACTN|nr:hypothetical protein [Glycomyces paridis]THV23578.1 hypothetical protein E9998_22545 [Glycomyces paridis]
MDAEITVHGTDDARGELASLLDWLTREDDMSARFAPAAIGPGELGAVQELLIAAIAAGGLDALGRTVAVWLRSRRPEIEVTIVDADGSSITVTAKGTAAKSITDGPDREA